MSRTIDEKVVSMRFDNSQFERNVQTSMSTLDKLKHALRLDGVGKGLEEVGSAANKLNFDKAEFAATRAGFHIQDVFEKTTRFLENNIARRIVDIGTNLFKTFAIDPLSTGFSEYELKMGSVQTILASTGEELATVNKYLDELNTYSDKTIYSFADMTSNIGKFTNAGVKLEDAVAAIKGVSNEAAISGANANEASRAMYNFAQALSAGYVKLIDWKSIENANMATMGFKKQLIETAAVLGTVTKEGDKYVTTTTNAQGKVSDLFDATHNFNDSLAHQWMTTEVLTETLKQYATDVRDLTEAEKKAYEEKLRGQGFTEQQIKDIEELGQKAADAAKDVKTFSMMMDTLKEAAQSGWAKTWELIFGDFEQGKQLWTNLSEFFGNIIGAMSDARNKLLESALGKAYTDLANKAKAAFGPIQKTADSIKKITDSVKDYSKVINEIIGGKWGNGQERWNKLADAGYNWAHAQNMVNEKLGSSVKHVTDYVEKQKEVSETQDKTTESTGKLTVQEKNRIKVLAFLSERQMLDRELTEEQIEALKELGEQADKLGMPLGEFIDNLDQINGRWILLNAFKNIGNSLVTVFQSIGKAYKEIFPPVTADQLFDVIAAFHKLSMHLVIGDDTALKLTKTIKGLFAALDILLTITAGPLKIAFKIFTQLLSAFDMNILDFTAMVGDSLVELKKWVDSVLDFTEIFEVFAPYIEDAADSIRQWVQNNIDLTESFKEIKGNISDVLDSVKEWIDGLKNAEDVPKYLMETLGKGLDTAKDYLTEKIKGLGGKLLEGIGDILLRGWQSIPSNITDGFNKGFLFGLLSIINSVRSFCNKVITTAKDLFGIHSPSTVFYDIGVNIVEGLINGISAMITGVADIIKKLFTRSKDEASDNDLTSIFDTIISGMKKFGSKLKDVFSRIDFGKVFAAGLSIAMLLVAKKALDVLEMFGKPLEGLGDMLSGIGEAFEGFGKNLKAAAMLKRAKAILIIAGAIAILVAAIIPLTQLSWEQLGKAGASLVVLSAVIAGLMLVLDKLGSKDISVNANLLIMAGSLLALSLAMKMLSKIAVEGNTVDTLKLLAGMIAGLAAIMIAFGLFVNADKSANMDKAGLMLFKMAAALLTMASVFKIVSGFTYSDITKGIKFVLGVGGLFLAITYVSKFAGEHADKAGAMMLKMSLAMLAMAAVVKIVSGFSYSEIKKGLIFILGVEALFLAAVLVSKISGENGSKAGSMILKMSLAMLAMVAVVKLVSKMSDSEIEKGLSFVKAIGKIFAALIAVSLLAGQNAAEAGKMLIAMSLALGVLVAITYIVSKLDAKEMWKAFRFVAAIEALFAGLMFVTKYAKATKQMTTTLILLLVAIGLMTAALVGLSFIDPKSLATATAAIASVMGMFAALMVVTKFTKNTKDMRKSLLALLGVTIVLAAIVAALSLLNPESALKSSAALSLLLISFSSSIVILSKSGKIVKSAKDVLLPMLGVALGLGLILAALSWLTRNNVDSLIPSAIALGILLDAFAASISILSKADTLPVGIEDTLARFWKVIVILGGTLAIMSFLPSANIPSLIASSVALGILFNAFATSMVILSKAGYISNDTIAAAALLGLVVGELAIILSGMSFLPSANIPSLIASAISLGILLNSLAASMILLNFVGPQAILAVPAVSSLGIVLVELGAILAIMSLMGVQNAIPNAIGLTILLVAITVVAGMLGAMSGLLVAAEASVISLGVVIAELGILLGVLGMFAQIPGLTWLISEGGKVLELIGVAIGQFIGGIVTGIAAGAALALPIIGAGLTAFMIAIQGFIIGAQSINSDVLAGVGYLSAAILLLTATELISGILSFAGIGFIALGFMLSGFIKAAQPFIDGIQNIDPSSVEACKNIADMILALTKADLIQGIASFLGVSTDFSTFGTQLVAFGDAVCQFSNTIRDNGGIDETQVESAARAGEMIAGLQNALYGSGGLKQDIFGEKDLSVFSTQLVAFGNAICEFSNTIKNNGGIDESGVESAAKAGEMIAGLQSALYGAGGLKQDIFGEKDLSVFATQLVAFGNAICEFNNTIKNNGGIDEESVASAVNAGKLIAGLQTEIEGAGGLKQDIFGEKNLADFGTQIKDFGQAIVDFSNIVTGNINEEAITSASDAGTIMAAVQEAIPEDKWLDGKISIDDFGEKIVKFGEGLVDYSDKVSEVDTESVNSSLYAARTLVSIAKSVVDLDTSGIETFEDVKGIGATIKAYAEKIKGVDAAVVASSVTSARTLVQIAKSAIGLDTSGIESFKSVKTIGSTIKGYSENVSGADTQTINYSISNARSLVGLIKSMVGLDTSGVSAFKTAISNLANINTSGLATAFKDTTKFSSLGSNIVSAIKNGITFKQDSLRVSGVVLANCLIQGITSRSASVSMSIMVIMNKIIAVIASKREMFNTSGVMLMSRLSSGMASQSAAVKRSATNAASSAVSGIRGYYDNFYNAGSYLVSGFADGISENSYKAVSKARAMAKAAYEAAKEELDINSPSKIFRSLGYSVPEGFAMGIDRMSNMVKTSSILMADTAINSVKRSITDIAKAINTDIDAQPVIRPVLDLSDVESGAGAISSLFNNNGSVGVLANVNGISTMMNKNNQNGVNDELVSAINKLRNDLNNVGNNYYTIEGVTYSDGSEVSEAVNLLTRAIKVEGRV